MLMSKRHNLGWHILLPLMYMCHNLLINSFTEEHSDVFQFLTNLTQNKATVHYFMLFFT